MRRVGHVRLGWACSAGVRRAVCSHTGCCSFESAGTGCATETPDAHSRWWDVALAQSLSQQLADAGSLCPSTAGLERRKAHLVDCLSLKATLNCRLPRTGFFGFVFFFHLPYIYVTLRVGSFKYANDGPRSSQVGMDAAALQQKTLDALYTQLEQKTSACSLEHTPGRPSSQRCRPFKCHPGA